MARPPCKKLRQTIIGADGRLERPTIPIEEEDRSYQLAPLEVKHYDLELRKERTLKKNMAREVIYEVKFDDEWQNQRIVDIRDNLRGMFEDVIGRAREGLNDNDLGRIYINQGNLWQPIVIPPRPLNELDAEVVMQEIEKVLQSEEDIAFDDSMEIHVGMINIPRVAGRPNTVKVIDQESLKCKRSIVRVRNTDDSMCLARAIVVCMAKEANDPKYNIIRKSNRQLQKERAIALHHRAGIPYDQPCSFNNLPAFERAIDRQIIVFSAVKGNKPIYVGENPKEQKVFLYHSFDDNTHKESGSLGHIDAIVNITGFIGTHYFCGHCLKGFSRRDKHRCEKYCKVCHRNCPALEKESRVCSDCNQTCRSQKCFEQHKKATKKGKPPCDSFWKCLECHSVIVRSRRETHLCGEWYCSTCKQSQLGEHFCYMTSRPRQVSKLHHITFDFECSQETTEHMPNFVVVQTDCDHCTDEPLTDKSKCSFCGRRCPRCQKRDKSGAFCSEHCADTWGFRDFSFAGAATQMLFCQWLFSEANRGATVIAHNAKGYDAYFLLDYLVNNVSKVQIVPQIIFSGSKIMYMHVKVYDIRVIDSLNFSP